MNANQKLYPVAMNINLNPFDLTTLSALAIEAAGVASPLQVATKLAACRQTRDVTRTLARKVTRTLLAEITNQAWARMNRAEEVTVVVHEDPDDTDE